MTLMHLRALLEGLDVPDPGWWVVQTPDALRALGKAISDQAKLASLEDGIVDYDAGQSEFSACIHRHLTDKEEPCRTCDHNVNAAPNGQS